jgi:DHA1 family multidrug resistance protein-like MFS transporter
MSSFRRVLQDEKLGLYAMVFLANMGWGVMTPVLGDIQAQFAVTITEVALANSVFGLARLTLDVPIGMLMERVDQRWLRLAGAVTLCGGSILCALAPTFNAILFGRLLSGVGAAIILVTNMVWISQLSTEERRGRDLGVYQALLQAGASISPIAGGVLADLFSWRVSFWFSAVISLLAFAPMLNPRATWIEKVRKKSAQAKKPEVKEETVTDRRTVLSALVIANLVTFVLFVSVGGFQNTVIPLFGSLVLGLDAGAIGLALGLSTILRFVVSLIGGELSDRYGRRAVLIPGLVLIGVGTVMFNVVTDLTSYCIAIAVQSIGRFGNNVPATVLADHAPKSQWAFLMGLNRMIGDLGVVLGPIAMGLLMENHGFGSTIVFSTAIVWLSALIAVVGVSEARAYQPIWAPVRRWLQISRRIPE